MNVPPTPGGEGIKSKGLIVGKTVKLMKCYKIEKGRGEVKSKMLKLKRKRNGVRIWNKNPEYISVRGSN